MTSSNDASSRGLGGAEIRRLLDRLGWGIPVVVSFLIVSVIAGFYQFRALPQAQERADLAQRVATEKVVGKIDGLVEQIERVVLTTQNWVSDGVISIGKTCTSANP